ncbi:hypothetical protein ELE36_07000 [Pseudolysobacter antarcticus]|uniref:Type I restriction modification DNA specificity domain-containing protein n=1 Tax=Pseudolysobacter antarcticus TaxID=2511995 RepID=A0A411HI10_9GAMM|nr:restriction endonuclease subunit S [Pseudolysobacter antarcticus]QBB70133.1 hypothetical protein ELE36_07000 [Pseudolysobacter antarcticus]
MSEVSVLMGWSIATIMDVARSSGGGTPSKSEPSYWDQGNIPWVSPKDMKSFFVTSSEDSITDKALVRLTLVPRDSVLIVVRSGILSRTLPVSINKIPVTINQDMRAFVPKQGIDARYLAWQFISKEREILDSCAKDGTTVASIEGPALASFPMAIAPLAEQTRIVEKLEELLSDLDAGVAELKAAQRKLVQYRQSLLKAAVEGALSADWRAARHSYDPSPPSPFLRKRGSVGFAHQGVMDSGFRENDRQSETGADLLQRILTERRARWETKQLAKFAEQGKTPPKDWQAKYPEPVAPNITELPSLPSSWVWASLDMLGEIASGVAKGTKRAVAVVTREVAYLRVANVQRGYLNLAQVKMIEATEADIRELRLLSGDVLFNEGGDLDKLGRGWVWRGEVPECIHQNHVFRMRPYLDATPSELISHHGNTFGKTWFKSAGKQTTNLASINMTMLRAFPVPIAPEAESVEILARLTPALDATTEQQKKCRTWINTIHRPTQKHPQSRLRRPARAARSQRRTRQRFAGTHPHRTDRSR